MKSLDSVLSWQPEKEAWKEEETRLKPMSMLMMMVMVMTLVMMAMMTMINKGIRDAGSTANFRILFEIFEILEILIFFETFNFF